MIMGDTRATRSGTKTTPCRCGDKRNLIVTIAGQDSRWIFTVTLGAMTAMDATLCGGERRAKRMISQGGLEGYEGFGGH
ncbi:hypothetical protein Q3G72_026230 [Acer saccharum]|nr:hypothetical protein Q3G72_026230 [Acer saccharum]